MKIVILIGTTASGKSEIALEVAKKSGAHILSCDSLLVYQDLNIGTAKPSLEDMQGVPHYGINLVNLRSDFTAADYVKHARKIINDLDAKNIPLIIAGGTGFYLKALLLGIWDAPPTHPEFRNEIDLELESLPEVERAPTLYTRLMKLDPIYASQLKPQDLYRVIRALEIIQFSGKKVSEIMTESLKSNRLPYEYRVFGINRTPRDLERRISQRMNQMFEMGLVNEVKALQKEYLDLKLPKPMGSVGYREVLEFLLGNMTLHESREKILISTRQLAKKQKTFFNGFLKNSAIETMWYSLPDEREILTETMIKNLV